MTSNTSWYLLKFRRNTILKLLEKGFHVICLAPKDAYSLELEALGADYIEINLQGSNIGPLQELRSLWAIFYSLKKTKPCFVFNFTIKMNIYFGLCCRLLGIPYCNNISGLGTAFLHKGAVYGLAKKLYRLANDGADRVFFQNEEDKNTFIDQRLVNAAKAKLLPGSGIDCVFYAYTPLPQGQPRVFIMIARLIADKGVREYVAAAAKIKLNYPQSRFILLGPGGVSNRSAIGEAEIVSWQRQAAVEYVGYRDDVISWIRQAHVLVLPSYREGMPRTVLEAASLGRPAIVTDVPGCRQAVEDGKTGWLCEVKSSSDLALVMRRIIEMPDASLDQFSLAARERMESQFSEDIVIQAYIDCLSGISRPLSNNKAG
ncbi:MAG: glycosyltransferase family 4 protein [Pseudomonadales bacterium]|nr:glycosyltransferase family 4 protein [Pseudomonadales bacterium]